MDNTSVRKELDAARKEIEEGDCKIAYSMLLPHIKRKNPEAIFLYSMFSLQGEESLEEFERRSFQLLKEAAELGYPPALYTLGVYYDAGDMVGRDAMKASSLFKAAAEKGHPRAKLSYGLDLFYGSNGISKDKSLGLDFIRQAADDEVEGALEMFDKLSAES
ncbi:hypothetical protein [uncultured Microbulbifer sp.]|uniref:tetratricopeptide repeat protein n=1 Tax=uncultured Microbulbifer sp. TaxID=348147 RepID=UPI002603AEA5|nr:hypothetical protein [uncultured Microbulbifer sp.]